MSIESDIARSHVEAELEAAFAWAGRHNWSLLWEPDQLRVRAATFHPHCGRLLEIRGEFDSYKALPPEWRFVSPNSGEEGAHFFPKAGDRSVFHPNLVICAPWNRLAYAGYSGLHPEWDLTGWASIGGDISQARTLGEMLSAIDVNLHGSPGMMA